MAVTLDQALGTGNSSGSLTTTFNTTATVAAGAHIILVAGRFNSAAVASTMTASGGGLSWTQDVVTADANEKFGVYRAHAPSGLASGTTLTITHSNINTDCIIGAGSYLGIDTSGTAVQSNTGSGSAAASWSAGSITPTAGNAIIGGAFQDGTTPCGSTATTGTELFDQHVGGQSETTVCNYHLSPAGATNLGGNWSANATYVAAAVEYKAAAGGAAGGVPAFHPLVPRLHRFGLLRTPRLGWLLPPAPEVATGVTYQTTGSLTAGTQFYGGDVFEASETGALTPDTTFSGADVFEASETGALTPDTTLSGADAFTAAEAGSLTPAVFFSGADASTFAETGSLTTQAFFAGTGSKAAEKAGALIAGVLFSGADAFTAAETGSLTPDTSLSGADVFEHNETGALTPATSLSGADVFEHNETGSLVVGALFSGVSVKITSGLYTKTGAILAGAIVSGGDAHTAVKAGALTPSALVSGADVQIITRAGSLLAKAFLAGASAYVPAQPPTVPGVVVASEGVLVTVTILDGALSPTATDAAVVTVSTAEPSSSTSASDSGAVTVTAAG